MKLSNHQYFDLSHFSLIEISGKDAFSFLHAQITADLVDLKQRGWLFSAWCLPNGRVICTFIVYASGNSLFLMLPSMMKDKIIKRLSMFVLRSAVTLTDRSEEYVLIGLRGAGIDDLAGRHITSPVIQGRLTQTELFSLLRLPDAVPRRILIGKIEGLPELLNDITGNCTPGERAQWSLLDIEAGLPWIINATSESFLPQMLNLEEMQGLSYGKGCYPGQEIVARLHYRGQVKKRLYLGKGDAEILPGPGDKLEDRAGGILSGDVIDAERHPDGGFRLLAVVETDYADSTALRIQGLQDVSVQLQPIPYP